MASECSHEWVKDGEVLVPPTILYQTLTGASEDLIRDVLFGYTVYRLRCKLCGDYKEAKLRGDHVGKKGE